jgi:TolA-binding protein
MQPSQNYYLEQKEEEIRKLKEQISQLELKILNLKKTNRQLKEAIEIMNEEMRMESTGIGGVVDGVRNKYNSQNKKFMVFKNKHPLCPNLEINNNNNNNDGGRDLTTNPLFRLDHPIYKDLLKNIKDAYEM